VLGADSPLYHKEKVRAGVSAMITWTVVEPRPRLLSHRPTPAAAQPGVDPGRSLLTEDVMPLGLWSFGPAARSTFVDYWRWRLVRRDQKGTSQAEDFYAS
jgi:hypothetical protein